MKRTGVRPYINICGWAYGKEEWTAAKRQAKLCELKRGEEILTYFKVQLIS